MSDRSTCFVISPIGSEGSDTRERSDKILEYIIEPVVTEFGYKPVRADAIAEPGMITSQVIDRVVETPLAVADLTGSNANVFYELAVRHAYKQPVIQIIDRDDNIPFDVSDTRIIKIDIEDIEAVENAKNKMKEQIRSIEQEDSQIETPLSVARDLKRLRESADPEDQSIAEIKEDLTMLRSNISSIQQRIEDPQELIPPEYMESIVDMNNIPNMQGTRLRLTKCINLSEEAIDELESGNEEEGKEIVIEVIETLESTIVKIDNSIL